MAWKFVSLGTWVTHVWQNQICKSWNVWEATLYFAGPDEWRSAEFEDYGSFVTIDEVIEEVDVMMFLRVQHERHDYESLF